MLTRKVMPLALLVALAFGLTACGPDLSSPDATLATYAKAFEAKDVDAMAQCFLTAEQADFKKEMEEAKKNAKEGEESKFTVTSKGSKKDGDFTVGTLTMKDDKNSIDLTVILVEEGGKWKISNAKQKEYREYQAKKGAE